LSSTASPRPSNRPLRLPNAAHLLVGTLTREANATLGKFDFLLFSFRNSNGQSNREIATRRTSKSGPALCPFISPTAFGLLPFSSPPRSRDPCSLATWPRPALEHEIVTLHHASNQQVSRKRILTGGQPVDASTSVAFASSSHLHLNALIESAKCPTPKEPKTRRLEPEGYRANAMGATIPGKHPYPSECATVLAASTPPSDNPR